MKEKRYPDMKKYHPKIFKIIRMNFATKKINLLLL